MTEPHSGLFYLPIIYLWTGGVEGDMLASLAPPVHLSGERIGWTMLVCMVSDFKTGHLEVNWRSPSESHMSSSLFRLSVNSKHRSHSAVATITVATRDWPSYSCSVTHRRRPRVRRRHHTSSVGHQDKCHEEEETGDVVVWTNTVVVLILRLLLLKIIIFNTLLTTYAVIRW